jgi:hypothetical protein
LSFNPILPGPKAFGRGPGKIRIKIQLSRFSLKNKEFHHMKWVGDGALPVEWAEFIVATQSTGRR